MFIFNTGRDPDLQQMDSELDSEQAARLETRTQTEDKGLGTQTQIQT